MQVPRSLTHRTSPTPSADLGLHLSINIESDDAGTTGFPADPVASPMASPLPEFEVPSCDKENIFVLTASPVIGEDRLDLQVCKVPKHFSVINNFPFIVTLMIC